MAEAKDPDAEMMLRVKRGDTASFEALVIKYQRPVINLIYRIVGDATEAEDLAQNVFLQAFRSADRYRVSAKFSTWLFTIARNLSLNELRRRSRHPAEPLDVGGGGGQEDPPSRQHEDRRAFLPADEMIQTELREKVAEALAALPENQRTAILLFREEGLPYEEIGRVLNVSLSATKSLIHRGRETLKRRLKPYVAAGVWDENE